LREFGYLIEPSSGAGLDDTLVDGIILELNPVLSLGLVF
jgi:hypothetical protein